MMDTLFPVETFRPEGFRYYPDFISNSQERDLIAAIEQQQLHTFVFQGFEARRRVASFGYDWNFSSRRLSKGKEVPSAFLPLIETVASHISIDPRHFAEVLLTEYPEGSVINWHRDAPPFDLIAGISLLSDCTFRMRPHAKELQGRLSVISVPVRRRSLYIIRGSSRTDWQHSILPIKSLRYSITLRTLKTNIGERNNEIY
jgi:alkylated DNA repair dioxygenase AlkB